MIQQLVCWNSGYFPPCLACLRGCYPCLRGGLRWWRKTDRCTRLLAGLAIPIATRRVSEDVGQLSNWNAGTQGTFHHAWPACEATSLAYAAGYDGEGRQTDVPDYWQA